MAAHGENDARVAARLLASTAANCLRNPAEAPQAAVELNNVYRLLEAFRENPFFGLESASDHNPKGIANAVAFYPALESHVREVQVALSTAIAESFGEPREEAIETIEAVLRGVTYPEDFAPPSSEKRELAMKFFDRVARQLQLA